MIFVCEGEKFLSQVLCWRGLNQCCPSWGIPSLLPEHGMPQEPQGCSSQTSPVTSADTCPAPISIDTISQVTPLLFSSFFNLFKDISVDQEHLVQNTGSCNTHPWQNDSSSILDGTSVTSDTQPAGLLCFLPPVCFFQSISSSLPLEFGERLL